MTSLSKVHLSLLSLLFALPLTFFPFSYLAFELPKVFLLYLFSALTIYILLASGYKFGNLTKISWIFLIFFAWIIVTSIFGLSLQQSFWGSYFRMQGILTWGCYALLFFISGKLFESASFRKHVSIAILISSSTIASLATAQFILLWFFSNTSQLLYSGRVISTFGQPNFLGAYLVMSLPFAWFLLKVVSQRWKILVWLGLVTIILGIFSTLSRSAYIGLFVLAMIWGFYHYRLLLAGIIISVMIFAILANLFPHLVYTQWYRFQVDTISKWTAENRQVIAKKSLELILQKPLTGYGLENFSLAFPKVVSINDLGLKDIVVDSSHNFFLDLVVQTGFVGLALFLLLLIVILIHSLKYLDSVTLEHKAFIKASISVIIAFLAVHQFSVISTGPLVLLWLSLGIVQGSSLKYSPEPKWNKYTIHFLGAILTGLIFLYIIQTIRAEILFRQASAYEVSDIEKAISLDNEAISLAPWIQFYTIRRDFLIKQLGF